MCGLQRTTNGWRGPLKGLGCGCTRCELDVRPRTSTQLVAGQPTAGTPSSAAALANVRSNVANGIPRRTATSK